MLDTHGSKTFKQQFDSHLSELSRNRDIPPFTDLPSQSGKCKHTGLKRGWLLDIGRKSGGLVRIVKLSEPGSRRGKLLIDLPRLLAYLRAVADCQAEGAEA